MLTLLGKSRAGLIGHLPRIQRLWARNHIRIKPGQQAEQALNTLVGLQICCLSSDMLKSGGLPQLQHYWQA